MDKRSRLFLVRIGRSAVCILNVHRGFKSTAARDEKSVSELVLALQACSKARDLEAGRMLHLDAAAAGLDNDDRVAAALVTMYSKCRSISLAREVFDGMTYKHVVTWTCLIMGYVENGESSIALDLFTCMDCQPTQVTYLAALKACAGLKKLEKVMAIHRQVEECEFDSNVVVASALVDTYGKCGNIRLAREAFDKIVRKNAVTWNSLILGYVENGESLVALDMFTNMDCEPTHVTYIAALKACTALASERVLERQTILEKGMVLHRQVRHHGFHSNIIVATSLVDMYRKCGNMRLARDVFDGMVDKTVVTWNCLILGYGENGQGVVALELFASMDCEPTQVTYLAALGACASLGSERRSERQILVEKGMAIHEQVKERSYDSNTIVSNTLVDMYCKCGNTARGREVFERMVYKDVVTWTSLILGYVENGESEVALELFLAMDCEPDLVAYVAVLKACAALARERESQKQIVLDKGMRFHEQVKQHGFDSDTVVSNTLLDMYCKCGNMVLAREVFQRMVHKDVVTWTCLILGCAENGESEVALELFTTMDCEPDCHTYVAVLKGCAGLASERQIILERGMAIHEQVKEHGLDSNVSVASALVDMYSRCRNMQLASEVFERMARKHVHTWNCLILGYVEIGECSAAVDLFANMNCEPTHVTYLTVLKACRALAALPAGQMIHSTICKLGLEEDATIATALVDFYSRSGCMAAAVEIFDSMHSPNIVSWTALLSGYSLIGEPCEVLSLAKKIEEAGLQMDSVTWVCVLTACSHAGMVEEGEMYFESLNKHGIRPTLEHYNCRVDMLGRANRFEEAFSIVNGMPFKPDEVTWMTLLGACRKWRNVQAGKVAFDALVCCQSKSAGAAYVMMGDIYGSLGMWQDWERMKARLVV